MDLCEQLADLKRSITLMRDATSIGQLMSMTIRNSSDQKGLSLS